MHIIWFHVFLLISLPTSYLLYSCRIMQTAGARGSERDVFYVSTSGWDHHSDMDIRLADKFTEMNNAIGGFVTELRALNLFDSTVLVQFSEFARTLDPNTGVGSDHAWGGQHFMLGGKVKGGKVLGRYPDSFEKGPDNEIIISRGRVVPTTPWDGEYDSFCLLSY